MMIDDRNRPPMFDDQMWAPTTVGIATNGIAPRRPCGCPQGTSVDCPLHRRVSDFDISMGHLRIAPPPELPRLHPDDLEAIARRVAELLRGAP